MANIDLYSQEIMCPKNDYRRFVLHCPNCRKYPCRQLAKEGYLPLLQASEYFDREFLGFEKMRCKMYLFKTTSGSIVEAPNNFDIDNPDQKVLENVEEIYVVSKVLRKQLKLVLKPSAECKVIRRKKNESRDK